MQPKHWTALAIFLSGALYATASPVTESVFPRWVRVDAAVLGMGLTHLLMWMANPEAFNKKLTEGGFDEPTRVV